MIRILAAFILMLGITSPALADIKTGKFSTAQMFDVQWNINGGTLNTSGFNYLYRSVPSSSRMTATNYAAIASAGQYFAFFDSTTNPSTFGMALYNSDGTLAEVIHNTGTFRALADGAIFYNGAGSWGTLITTAQGYNIGDSASFPVEEEFPSNSTMSAWVPDTTTPLAAGQSAGTTQNASPVASAGADLTVVSGAPVTLDGSGSSDPDGDTLTYAWTQTSGTSVTLSDITAAQPTFTAPTLAVGDADAVLVFSLTVNDGTVTSSANTVSITVQAPSPTPATEFLEYQQDILTTMVDDAGRNLRSTISANQLLTRNARNRMIETQRGVAACQADQSEENDASRGQSEDFNCALSSVSTRNYVPFDVDGTFAVHGTTLSTRGSFFELTGNYEGTQRRLFFGDFDLQHDGDTDSTTATLTARVAWEQMTTDITTLGYFIGGELATSNISGVFEGEQDRVGMTVGGYVVHQLVERVYIDGLLSLGAGRNDLEIANDLLALTSDYTTRTATMGAALSGLYEYEQYEFRPELAFSYGQTLIGNVGFTGRAHGLVDDTLSLDAGNVSIASLTLRPEVIWILDADSVTDSNAKISFAPRAVCERTTATTRTEHCGTGAELGLSSASDDGLSNAGFRVIMDRVGNSNRSSYAFSIEHRF